MSAWVTQEDREEMIRKFTRNRRKNRKSTTTATVEVEGQRPIEVSFLSPEELAARREGVEFGERQNQDRNRPYRPGQISLARRM